MSSPDLEEKKQAARIMAAELSLAGAPRKAVERALSSAYGLQPVTAAAFDPDDAKFGDILGSPPLAPPFIIDRFLPRSHGVENAIGGAGKTTRHIWEAIHIILGRDLYGQKVLQPGPVLIFTKEDDQELYTWRLHNVLAAMPDLSIQAKRRVLDELRIHYLTGTEERLVTADKYGNLTKTPLAERVVRGYENEGIALVEFDPMNFFGPGERFINDGEAATLNAMAFIGQGMGAAVRATSHVSKAVGRDGTSDAHSGRGGAAGGDNSRFVWNYWKFDGERDKSLTVPIALQRAADTGNLFRLHVAKLTAALPARERLWIVREGFRFEWHPEDVRTPQERASDALEADAHKVLAYLRTVRAKGAYHSLRDLQGESKAIGVSQRTIAAAIGRLVGKGLIFEAPLPANLQQGGRQNYWEIKPDNSVLDNSQPVFPG